MTCVDSTPTVCVCVCVCVCVYLLCAAVGCDLQTLVHRGDVVTGVTLLDNLLYVLRNTSSRQIEVYDRNSHRLKRRLTVSGLGRSTAIVACAYYRCGYIGDIDNDCIHRLSLPGADVTQWPVSDDPTGVSVTDRHSVLVTCRVVREIEEFTTDGQLIRQLQLPDSVKSPQHTIQLSSGEFILTNSACFGDPLFDPFCVSGPFSFLDPLHAVCLISSGGQLVKSYISAERSGSQQMLRHFVVDRRGFVFVADYFDYRVLLLSPSLNYIREVVSRDRLQGCPQCLCLDADESRLYVAVSDGISCGRLVVVNV